MTIKDREVIPGTALTPSERLRREALFPLPLPVTIVPPERPKGAPPPLLYKIDNYSLNKARSDEEHNLEADYLLLWTDGDSTDIRIRLNSKNADLIYMSRFNPIPGPVTSFYLSNSVQAGKVLSVISLRNVPSTYPMSAPTQQTISAVTKPSFSRLKSDKDLHFTGALVTNAIETEDITGLASNKIVIRRVTLQSDQQLNYVLLFWAKDTFQTSDLDTDMFLGEINLDLPAIGRRIAGAGQYYADLEVTFQYQDDDSSRELHVGLLNLDATSKIAGATGEVAIEVFYEEAT